MSEQTTGEFLRDNEKWIRAIVPTLLTALMLVVGQTNLSQVIDWQQRDLADYHQALKEGDSEAEIASWVLESSLSVLVGIPAVKVALGATGIGWLQVLIPLLRRKKADEPKPGV